MGKKRAPTTDAVEILRRRYYEGRPERLAGLAEARLNAAIAREIYELRTKARLTQKQLAGLLGLQSNSLAMIERGERPITRVMELAITALQPTACWLYPLRPGAPPLYPKHNGQYVHRLIYEQMHGPIPEGYVIDHLCQHKRCINPNHHELVTVAENTRRAGQSQAESNRRQREALKKGHDRA